MAAILASSAVIMAPGVHPRGCPVGWTIRGMLNALVKAVKTQSQPVHSRKAPVSSGKIGVGEGHVTLDHVEGGVAEDSLQTQHVAAVDEVAPGERMPERMGAQAAGDADPGASDSLSVSVAGLGFVITVGGVRRQIDPRPLPTDGRDRPHRRCE
jgi:hypothetical protein